MDLSREQIVEKLEEISALRTKALGIKRKIETYEPEDNYEREVVVPEFPGDFEDEDDREQLEDSVDHADDDAIELMSDAYDELFHPAAPAEPVIPQFSSPGTSDIENKGNKLGCLSYLAIGVSVFFALSLLLGTADGAESTITIIAIVAAVLFVVFRILIAKNKDEAAKKVAKAKAAYDSKVSSLHEQHKNAMKAYEAECAAYIPVRQAFLDEYAEWREIYLESEREEGRIRMNLEDERLAAVEKMKAEEYMPVLEELQKKNDLLTSEYLSAVDVIIELLKTGRADSVKEAINLYEDILYRERQLALEREKEEQRRYEEEQRRADEERRHREDMEERAAAERQRRREEEQRRSDEERRHREDMARRESEARSREYQERERARREEYNAHMSRIEEERKLSSAAQAQCRACAHAGRCNMMVHNKTPNCTGFTPRH